MRSLLAFPSEPGESEAFADPGAGLASPACRSSARASWVNRFTQEDAAGYVDGGNRYQFETDSPSDLSDPSGTQATTRATSRPLLASVTLSRFHVTNFTYEYHVRYNFNTLKQTVVWRQVTKDTLQFYDKNNVLLGKKIQITLDLGRADGNIPLDDLAKGDLNANQLQMMALVPGVVCRVKDHRESTWDIYRDATYNVTGAGPPQGGVRSWLRDRNVPSDTANYVQWYDAKDAALGNPIHNGFDAFGPDKKPLIEMVGELGISGRVTHDIIFNFCDYTGSYNIDASGNGISGAREQGSINDISAGK